MNPHFLGNALNAVAALSTVAPQEVPRATGRLRQFLRASFDQQERILVPLEEELALVSAYLDIEALRLGDRLKVEQTIDPLSLNTLVPPFSFQPLVESAIQLGLHSSPRPGLLQLAVCARKPWLELNVSDNGQGVSPTEVEHVFFAERTPVHALALLRRRLQGVGRSFQPEVRSEIGEGTRVTLRVPLRKQFAEVHDVLQAGFLRDVQKIFALAHHIDGVACGEKHAVNTLKRCSNCLGLVEVEIDYQNTETCSLFR